MNTILSYLPYLYNKPIEHKFSVDEKKVEDLLIEAKRQSIFIAVFNLLRDQLKDGSDKWERLYWTYVSYNMRNQSAHQELHKLLFDSEIQYVVLKGMASARFYPDPMMRTMGDVDFLVSVDDLEKTRKLLLDNGFTQIEANNHNFHIVFKKNGILFELHWACPGVPKDGKEGEAVRKYLKNIIEKAEFYDGYMVPSDFHHGIILLLHSASHMTTTGMGLRHLCDWAVFSNGISDSQFHNLFVTPLKEMGLFEYARILTAVSSKYLGIDHKLWTDGVDEEIVDLIMQDILDSGNFGVKDDQRINQAKLMRDDATRGVARAGMIKTLIRNLNIRAKKNMPITAKTPVLLPIGWGYVCFIHLIRICQGKRSSIKIGETVTGAEKRSKLYSKLKLFEGEE